jgi:hypothetical protein
LPLPTPPPVMNVIMIAVMAHMAAGKTLLLNSFVRCTTEASCLEASLSSLPVPMKKNIVIDCENSPTTTVTMAVMM